jgi:hypothetical protein
MSSDADRVAAVLARLEQHFGRSVRSSPSDQSLLETLDVKRRGELLATLYSITDGIELGLQGPEVGRILSCEELLAAHSANFAWSDELTRLTPIRRDGCGNFDCLVSEPGVGAGSVVFWDHEIFERPSHLLGSSLTTYLEMWSDFVICAYLPNGSIDPRFDTPALDGPPWIGEAGLSHPWPYDVGWMREHDPEVDTLLSELAVRRWLADQGE